MSGNVDVWEFESVFPLWTFFVTLSDLMPSVANIDLYRSRWEKAQPSTLKSEKGIELTVIALKLYCDYKYSSW